ncbi:MAG: family 16 glycosylhydrolase [Mediterranea sp.]|jgi:beta-glucanase (GH16 family)|nr:family 16 glycosylhydrolase [Mediterranea sp.]
MKTFFYLLYFPLLGIAACGSDNKVTPPEPEVSIGLSAELLTPDYAAQTQTVTVTANAEWGVSSDAEWCTCSPSGGIAGTTTLKVTVAKNSYGQERTATLTFKSGNYRKTLDVKQGIDPAINEIKAPEGYTLVWHDEFDAPRGADGAPALPNRSEWWFETGGGGWGNNELETYIDAVRGTDTCAVVSDGTLKIIAKKVGDEVLSVRMNTSKSWKYGYFEARLKLPSGKGTWPAFWMMPQHFTAWPDDGEIDIMEEVGYRPNYVSSSIHTKAYNHSIGTQKTGERLVEGAEGEFHVYALEWTEASIKGYCDGVCHFTFQNDNQGNKDTWPFNAAFYLKLNLAWGGNWGGAQGVDESKLPAVYEIEYVRVFQKQ